MKQLIKEFRDFINRGNVMDLAVAVVIGGAFTAVVTSLTTNIINPLIELVTGGATGSSALVLTIGSATLDFSAFIGSIINFFLVALVVFAIVKAMNKAAELSKKAAAAAGVRLAEEEAQAPEPPMCPFCKTEIPEGAVRCPHCTSELPEPAAPRPKTA